MNDKKKLLLIAKTKIFFYLHTKIKIKTTVINNVTAGT
jgi:hypothetical protein